MYRLVLKHDVGAQAPGFTLKGADGEDVSLDSYRGRAVVLIFFAGGYDAQAVKNLREFADHYQRVQGSDAAVVAITPEIPGKVKTLADQLQPPFAILSDPDMRVVREYDVYNPEENWTWPAAFVIDKDGTIQYAFRGASAPNTPPVHYILAKLLQMKEGKAPAPAHART